jgi:hypothetical protein
MKIKEMKAWPALLTPQAQPRSRHRASAYLLVLRSRIAAAVAERDHLVGTYLSNMPIQMKSPGHSEMIPPMDSDMMSPRARASLAAEL